MKRSERIVWSATPTPFLPDGSLDNASVERLVAQHLKLGVTGLFVAGTCGEGPYMPDEQRVELARLIKRAAGGRLHVAAQVSDTSVARVKVNIRKMQDVGVDSVVIARPFVMTFYNRDFARRYFVESIEAATLPVGIYVTGKPDDPVLPLDSWREIARHPKVSFVKDSSGSVEMIGALAEIKAQRPGLTVMTGNEFDILTAVARGYDGALVGTGILTGRMVRHALRALDAGDRAAADQWQTRANEFLYGLFARDLHLWLGGLKYALKRLGVFSDEFMHLNYPLSAADRARIDAAVERERSLIA